LSMRSHGLIVVALLLSCGGSRAVDLKVTGSPTGAITGQIHLTLAFSRPMVARDQLDKVVAAPPVKIAPELPGEAKWTDDKTLVVWPKADLPISTKYVVTVPKGTRALDGNELPDDVSFELFTQRLTATPAVMGSAER